MKDFFANIAIGGAGVAAFLTLLDWFLTDKQKEQLSLLSLRLWNWLDDVYRRRFLEWFYKGRPQFVIAVLSVISYFILIFVVLDRFGVAAERSLTDLPFTLSLILGTSLAVGIFRPLLRWLSGSQSQLTYLSRLYAAIAAYVLIVVALFYVGFSWVQTISDSIPDWAAMPWLVCGLSVVITHGTFSMLWSFLFATTISLFIAKIIVQASAFIMRRVAEADKGPVLAISALVGGIAALVKAMQ
jgi:hypothetical protein